MKLVLLVRMGVFGGKLPPNCPKTYIIVERSGIVTSAKLMTSKNFKTRVRIFSFPFYRATAKTTRNVLD